MRGRQDCHGQQRVEDAALAAEVQVKPGCSQIFSPDYSGKDAADTCRRNPVLHLLQLGLDDPTASDELARVDDALGVKYGLLVEALPQQRQCRGVKRRDVFALVLFQEIDRVRSGQAINDDLLNELVERLS